MCSCPSGHVSPRRPWGTAGKPGGAIAALWSRRFRIVALRTPTDPRDATAAYRGAGDSGMSELSKISRGRLCDDLRSVDGKRPLQHPPGQFRWTVEPRYDA